MHESIEKIKSRLKVGSYCFQMLCHLEQGGTFTVWEARDLFGCTSTLARIAELRDLGVPIVSTPEDNNVRYSMREAASQPKQNLYQQAAAEIIAKHLPCVDNWQMYSFAKQAYQQMTLDFPFNEFEFCCACRAFENHFVNSKGM